MLSRSSNPSSAHLSIPSSPRSFLSSSLLAILARSMKARTSYLRPLRCHLTRSMQVNLQWYIHPYKNSKQVRIYKGLRSLVFSPKHLPHSSQFCPPCISTFRSQPRFALSVYYHGSGHQKKPTTKPRRRRLAQHLPPLTTTSMSIIRERPKMIPLP